MPHRQVGPLDVGRAGPQHRQNLLWIAVDHLELRADDTAMDIALFDHLRILPVGTRPFLGRSSSDTLVGGHLPVDRNHRFADASPTIGERRRGTIRVPTRLERLENLDRGVVLAMPRDTRSRVWLSIMVQRQN